MSDEIPAGTKVIWRIKDTDTPITITGVMGYSNGVRYYSNDGGNGGAPEDQLIYANGESKVDFSAILKGNFHTPEDIERERQEKAAQDALLTQGAHDEGNAQCVNLRYCGQFIQNKALGWLHYTGTHWTSDGAEESLDRAIIETLLARIEAALRSGKSDQYKELINRSVPTSGKVTGTKHLFSSLVHKSEDYFDTAFDLLNCKNGVVDLRTGELLSHRADYYFTYCTAVEYKPNADFTAWVEWLLAAIKDGFVTVDWLQMAIGYSLTGHTREEILFYLYGPPRSGKGTFTESLLALLNKPLAKEVNFATFTALRLGDSQNFDLAPLKPCRFVAASESNTYERFNEAKIKALTGGNEVYCAFKHHTHFNYKPQFKIWLSSNQPINADPDDDAVWGRIRVVEFPISHLGSEDKSLKYNMRSAEILESILTWAVQGAIRWYALGKSGLPELERSAQAKAAHRAELDNVQAWLDESCECADMFCAYSSLYNSYESWCKDRGVEPKKQKSFSQSLSHKGYIHKASKQGGKIIKGFNGLKLL